MSDMQFGFSRRIINPEVPISLAGYFTVRPWDRILDNILVQSFAVRQDAELAVLLQFDLVSISRDMVLAIREQCSDVQGLKPENIILVASHTHTAPTVRQNRPGGNPAYNHFAIEQAVKAVHESLSDLAPGTIEFGSAENDRQAFNRRYWMKDGSVVTNPRRRDPQIDRPEGPIDPHIGIVRIRRQKGHSILLVNISNHPDCIGGNGVSADWHGALRASLEQEDAGLRVITLTAPEGNVNHFNPFGPDEQSGYPVAQRLGAGYAASVREALPGLQPSATRLLRAAFTVLRVGPREIDAAELEQAQHDAEAYADAFSDDMGTELTSEDLATRSPAALKYFADRLLEVAADREPKELELHALRLGDVVLVTLPGEPFVEYGLGIRRDFRPGLPTLVAALGDGRATYIPTPDHFGRGGYETTPRCSPYSVKTGDMMLDSVQHLLAQVD